jgi:insulysin
LQPGHYLSHLLGHEGAGSILCFLKQKGWANYLSSGPIPGGINFDFFKVSIDLTEDGLDHYEDVVATVFQYIRMMKKVGVRESIFREVQSLAQLSFKFRENFPPSQYTSRLVEQMHQTYPREWVISGSSLFREYDPHVIQENLEWLREDGFRMTISTRNLPNGIVLTKREKWYDTEYEEMPILQSVIDVRAS